MSSISLQGNRLRAFSGWLWAFIQTSLHDQEDIGKNKVISWLNPCSAASTLFCCSLPRPASHKGSAFSQGPEVNLLPDRMTAVWSKNGSKRCIYGGGGRVENHSLPTEYTAWLSALVTVLNGWQFVIRAVWPQLTKQDSMSLLWEKEMNHDWIHVGEVLIFALILMYR